MPTELPDTTSALGNKTIIVLSTPPADPSAPTLAELNAGLFAQCHIYGNLTPAPTQGSGQPPAKLCTKTQDSRPGRVVWDGFDVQYSYMPQRLGAAGGDGNELYEELVPETFVHVYIADGLDGEDTAAIVEDDVINHGFYVEVGEYREGQTGDGEFDEFATTQTLYPKGGRVLHNYPAPAA